MNVRTDERTNGRKLARLCLSAKAGATIKRAVGFKAHFGIGHRI